MTDPFYLRRTGKPLALDLREIAAIQNAGSHTRLIFHSGQTLTADINESAVAALIEKWAAFHHHQADEFQKRRAVTFA